MAKRKTKVTADAAEEAVVAKAQRTEAGKASVGPGFKNKERVLVVSSRGITFR